jgi:hypothetical protein
MGIQDITRFPSTLMIKARQRSHALMECMPIVEYRSGFAMHPLHSKGA